MRACYQCPDRKPGCQNPACPHWAADNEKNERAKEARRQQTEVSCYYAERDRRISKIIQHGRHKKEVKDEQ